MTPEARAAMRRALREALGTADLPDGTASHPGVFGAESTSSIVELEQRFAAELVALGGEVHHAGSLNEVVALVGRLLSAEGAREVLAWNDECLPVPGVRAALERAGFVVHRQRPEDAHDAERRAVWAGAGVGLTGAAACLADTGSIVVVSGPGRGRLASLLPPIHVALVSRQVLTRSLPTLFARQPDLATSGANLVCITGPSRTADIEHHLIRGVHGPREVHVVFVD